MFNNGEAGQNRTARGAIHNDCPVFHVFPFRVPLPVLHPTLVCGSSVLSFLRFLGFPCGVSSTIPAPFRLRCVHFVFHRSRGFLCFPCPSMVSCARPIYVGFNPHKAWGIVDARPVTAGRSCILRAVATFVIVSASRWAYAIAATRGAGSLMLCYSCRSLSVLSKSGSSGGREQNRFL